jgi:hypothetical protein
MKSKYEEKIFNVLLLLIVGTFVVMSFSYNSTARMFPLYFGIIPFILILLNLIVGNMKNPPKFLRFIKQEGTMSNLSSKEEGKQTQEEGEQTEEPVAWSQIIKITLWLVFYIIALIYIYYLLATFIFLTLLLRIAGKVPLLKTLLISICFTGFLYVLFEIILFNRI